MVILLTECFPHEGFNYSQQLDRPDIILQCGLCVTVCVYAICREGEVCVDVCARGGITPVSRWKCGDAGGEAYN